MVFNVISPIKRFLHAIVDNAVSDILLKEKINRRTDFLTDRALHCKDLGITDKKYCDEDIIVTLTSYGKRINTVYLAIESIMQGSMLPNKIILWLAENDMNEMDLPQTLINQRKRGLEICCCEDIRSFKKLIPALKKYPDSCLVTIDDDLIYDYNTLEYLIRAHKSHPGVICAKRTHRVKLTDEGKIMNYHEWDKCLGDKDSSFFNFATSGAGTLFPPQSFSSQVFSPKAMEICSHADDVWFYCMALLNGTKTFRISGNQWNGEDYLEIEGSQIISLMSYNTTLKQDGSCENDIQLKTVLELYPAILEKLKD